MKKSRKLNIKLTLNEYNSLIGNEMIRTLCAGILASPEKRGGYIVLRLTEGDLKELIGFVAAEANHATTKKEEEVLGDVFDNLDGILFDTRMKSHQQQ